MEKGVVQNFVKFTVKHLCQSLFFNKVAGPAPKIFKNIFFRVTPLIAASDSYEELKS